jgi:hypothetical protein
VTCLSRLVHNSSGVVPSPPSLHISLPQSFLSLATPTMATTLHSFDCDQSFVTSLPLYNSPFLEQPFSPCQLGHHPTSSSSICSNLQEQTEVMNIQRVSIHRSTANFVSLKEPPPTKSRSMQTFWDSFTETSSNKAIHDHSIFEDDIGISDEDSVSSIDSSSAFSTPSPTPIRKKSISFHHQPLSVQDRPKDGASRYVRPRILVFKRPLSPIVQSSSTKSCNSTDNSPKAFLASPFKPVLRKRQPKKEAEVDWTYSLDTSEMIGHTSCPSLCLSPSRDANNRLRRGSLIHSKSEGDFHHRHISKCTRTSEAATTPPFCGMSLPFVRRSTRRQAIDAPSTPTPSPRLLSSSSKSSPINTIHRHPSVSFADLVEITSALLAAPSPQSTPPKIIL